MLPEKSAALLLPLAALLPACGGGTEAAGAPEGTALELAMADGYSASLILDGLNNPSGVSFSDSGQLTVCDSGNGKVILFVDGEATDHLTGFPTEFWKTNAETGAQSFGLGPLSAVWLGDTLAVTNAGAKDGEETIQFYTAAGTASDANQTNAVPPTTEEDADKGEGNLTGMGVAGDGDTIYVCGQGFDGKSWVLRAQLSTKELAGFASADDAGIAINSPMQALCWDDDTLLVLYSGAGGTEDGTIVAWNTESGEVEGQYSLPGVVDPMGMDRIPGTDELAVVDNNWSLTEVKAGSLVRVSLPAESGAAEVTSLSSALHGPVSCAFGPDGRLYIAQLGTEFDSDKGQVLAVSGF